MSKKKEFTLAEIAHHTGSKVVGDSTVIVNNLSTLEAASSDSLSFYQTQNIANLLAPPKHRQSLFMTLLK